MLKNDLRKYGLLLWFLFVIYTIISFLLLLRDDFIMERLSLLTHAPWFLELGRKWAVTLHVNSFPTPLYVVTVVGMFLVYFRVLERLKNAETKMMSATTKMIMTFSLAFMLTLFFSFPALSTDVFDYISSNRVLFVHHANPWLEPPQNFPDDQFIYLGSWKFRASVYGPVQFLFSSLAHLIAQDHILTNIAVYKGMGMAFLLLTIFVVKTWLKDESPQRLAYGLAVIAWNPLLLIEIVGNAHNDIIMAFFSLLGCYLFYKKRYNLSALALACAVLAKMTALLILPLLGIWLIGKHRLKQSAQMAVTFILVTLSGMISLGSGFSGLMQNLGIQLGLYLRSLPTILRFFLLNLGLSNKLALYGEKALTLPAFGILVIKSIQYLKHIGFISAIVVVMTGYLMLVSPMLQPWYLVWVLPFVALLKRGKLQLGMLTFSMSSLLYYSVLFVSYYFSPLHFSWQIVMFLFMIIPPLIVWFTPQSWYTLVRSKE